LSGGTQPKAFQSLCLPWGRCKDLICFEFFCNSCRSIQLLMRAPTGTQPRNTQEFEPPGSERGTIVRMPTCCPRCDSVNIRRPRSRNCGEQALSWLSIRPVRCADCRVRLWQFRSHFWNGKVFSFHFRATEIGCAPNHGKRTILWLINSSVVRIAKTLKSHSLTVNTS
jgi:hypothetical protein